MAGRERSRRTKVLAEAVDAIDVVDTVGSRLASLGERSSPASLAGVGAPSALPIGRRRGVRDEQKQRTRRGLLDAALEQLGHRAFTALSLREVAKSAGVVPAAFYRHFPDMESLGLALVAESFAALRPPMRQVRAQPAPTDDLVRASVGIFLGYVVEHPLHFRFIARERSGGSTVLRTAIRQEIRLWVSELATDLARFPDLRRVDTDDLQMVAALVVQCVMAATELVLDADPDDAAEIDAIHRQAIRQVHLVLLGAAAWRSDRS